MLQRSVAFQSVSIGVISLIFVNCLTHSKRSTGLHDVSHRAIICVTRVVTRSHISMPKLAEKSFNDLYLKNLKPGLQRKDYYDAAQRGLGIRVAPSGLKTWFVMRRVNARMTRKTLGRYPELSLSEARIKAGDLLSDMAKGHVPERKIVPVLLLSWKNGSRRTKRESVASPKNAARLSVDVLPKLGPVPIDAIGKSDIRSIIDSIVARGAPIHANRVLAYLRRLFNWAVERDIIAVSPAEKIKAPTAERSRDRTLSAAELAAVWNATASLGPPFDAYFQLLILTGQRRNEVAGAQWTEFDLEQGRMDDTGKPSEKRDPSTSCTWRPQRWTF